jgi:hypothetical protein
MSQQDIEGVAAILRRMDRRRAQVESDEDSRSDG